MLNGSPWVYMHSPYHQMITQERPKDPWASADITPRIAIFQPLHAARKQSSPHQWDALGGPTGVPIDRARDPAIG